MEQVSFRLRAADFQHGRRESADNRVTLEIYVWLKGPVRGRGTGSSHHRNGDAEAERLWSNISEQVPSNEKFHFGDDFNVNFLRDE